jgi:hypothetical protein
MKVYVLVEVVYDSPENPGATVYSTREAAEAARDKAMAEIGEDNDRYIAEIIETAIQ